MVTPPNIGRYHIERELGRGGMGVVYRAIDPELDRPVAVKLILLAPDASRELRDELEKRFRREAKAAARIRHPGVVAIHDVGTTAEGLFLVMELVEGGSLADRLERGEFPDRATSVDLVARAAEALAAAHRAGVVHRDVKPANVMLASDGRVLLTDFGVARSLDEVSELTRTGMVVGSPAYMAPEQLQGAAVDGRADLFSLGVVLYELLLRKRPFPAQSITTLLYQILHEDPLADPSILRELDPPTAEVLRRLLAKRPEDRFQDGATAAAALRALPVMERAHDAPTQVAYAPPPPSSTPTAAWNQPSPPPWTQPPAQVPPAGSPPGSWPTAAGAAAARWAAGQASPPAGWPQATGPGQPGWPPGAVPSQPGWPPGPASPQTGWAPPPGTWPGAAAGPGVPGTWPGAPAGAPGAPGTWPGQPVAGAGWPGAGPTPTPWPGAPPRRRSNLALLWVGTAIAALVVAGGVMAWWRGNPERPRVEGARLANAGWDPAAAGALPEPTGTPIPVATPDFSVAFPTPTPVPLAPRPAPPPPVVEEPAAPVYAERPNVPAPAQEPAPAPPPVVERPAPPPPPAADVVVACREELELDVDPEEAQVWLDGRFLGSAEDVETIKFDSPGTYRVRFVHAGYHPRLVEVHVGPDARRKSEELELEMPEIEEPE